MTTPVTTQFVDALEAALKTITKANGFHTDLGFSVRRGFFGHILSARGAVFPAIVIHPSSETLGRLDGGRKKGIIELQVPLVIAVQASFDAQSYDELQACTTDVRRALIAAADELAQLGRDDTFSVGTAIPDLSQDSKFALAAFSVGISIVETYQN